MQGPKQLPIARTHYRAISGIFRVNGSRTGVQIGVPRPELIISR